MTERKWRDFSEMPDDALRAFADDLANPSEALKRIRSKKRELRADGETANEAKK